MEIIKVKPDNLLTNALERYAITTAPGHNLAKIDADSFRVKAWAIFKDGDGERAREVLAIQSEDGDVYRTISAIFKKSFINIVENFVEYPVIAVAHGTSKNGRDFIDCVLVGE